MSVEIPELGLVIPCYKEECNLRELIKAIRETDKTGGVIAEFYGKK